MLNSSESISGVLTLNSFTLVNPSILSARLLGDLVEIPVLLP